MFSDKTYWELYGIVFSEDYPGYRPDIVESPNGDGNLDSKKRYAHVAYKYLAEYDNSGNKKYLMDILNLCHEKALVLCEELNIPEDFRPVIEYSALRVLEYPPQAFSHAHKDFDLFTLMVYRDEPECFQYIGEQPTEKAQKINPMVHYGEIMEELGIARATKHQVLPSDVYQHSLVYFVIPDWKSKLPNGLTVEDWLKERLSRSRY